MHLELICVPSNYGRGANDGAYYPVGLMTIGTYLKRNMDGLGISVIDLHHNSDFKPIADVVGISASSTLNYENVLKVAQKAKDKGATVILGGQHATKLSEQILRNRGGLIDYVIRGPGEIALLSLLRELSISNADLGKVPNLSWRNTSGEIVHNYSLSEWNYDSFLPLDFTLLKSELNRYWEVFSKNIDRSIDAAFPVFTHFGCGYRNQRYSKPPKHGCLTSWCSYCSLSGPVWGRSGQAIVREAIALIQACGLPKGSKVLLKCYGDNVGYQRAMLEDLSRAIKKTPEWQNYNIGWTFYCQSSQLNRGLSELLARVGTWNLYIGFDSVDDKVQRLNGLGTSIKAHRRAIDLAKEYRFKIQAGFVLGCAGETEESIKRTLSFAEELSTSEALERINAAVLFVSPGAPAYTLLCHSEPWIRDLDLLPTREIQLLWLKNFCPNLGKTPQEALTILEEFANKLDSLSSGPHASMGFISQRLAAQTSNAVQE